MEKHKYKKLKIMQQRIKRKKQKQKQKSKLPAGEYTILDQSKQSLNVVNDWYSLYKHLFIVKNN